MNVISHPLTARVIPAFRLVAILEAFSWAGLLLGMLLKHVLTAHVVLGTELVSIFGMVHGVLVMVYVALAVAVALRLRWSWRTLGLALVATVPPFATVAFDIWADRRGKYRVASAAEA